MDTHKAHNELTKKRDAFINRLQSQWRKIR